MGASFPHVAAMLEAGPKRLSGKHSLQTQPITGEEVDARDAFKLLRRVMLPPQWLPEGSEPLEVSAVKSAKVRELCSHFWFYCLGLITHYAVYCVDTRFTVSTTSRAADAAALLT